MLQSHPVLNRMRYLQVDPPLYARVGSLVVSECLGGLKLIVKHIFADGICALS